MKNNLLKFALFTAVLATLAGCGTTPSSSSSTSQDVTSEEPVSQMTKEEKIAVMREVAEFVPIITEDGTGTVLYSDEVSELKDGRDLTVRTLVNRFGNEVTITWTYKEGVDGANRPLATYEVKPINTETASVRPGYPTYDLVINTSGVDVSVVPPTAVGRLYANLSFGGETLRINFDMYLTPQIKINWKELDVIRDTEINAVVGARGYITSIYPDYDAITIQDGEYALTLYKTQAYSGRGLKIGDYIEAAGSWRPYNGLAEIGWIVRLNLADPVENEAVLPVTHAFTAADFKEWYDAQTPTDQFLTALYDFDSALITIDEPLTILRAENREAQTIELSALPTGNTHANIILGATVGEGSVEIKLSISYHIGTAAQQAIKDKIIAAGIGGKVTYSGILNWFNEPVLGIMTAADITVVA